MGRAFCTPENIRSHKLTISLALHVHWCTDILHHMPHMTKKQCCAPTGQGTFTSSACDICPFPAYGHGHCGAIGKEQCRASIHPGHQRLCDKVSWGFPSSFHHYAQDHQCPRPAVLQSGDTRWNPHRPWDQLHVTADEATASTARHHRDEDQPIPSPEWWTGGAVFYQTLKNMLRKFVSDTGRDWECYRKMAQENLRKAQQAQKKWYDQHARTRELQPGKKVLLLLPTSTNKLLMKWQGPYTVVRKMGPVTRNSSPWQRQGNTDLPY